MNTLLDTLPTKEKEIFKQVISFYDEKKFKKSLKLLNKLIDMNPVFTGFFIRIHGYESTVKLLFRN